MDIFLSRNGQQFGPYALEWIESFLAEGTIGPDDLAWTAGREEWVPVSVLLAELRPQPEPQPEPEPEPAPEPKPESEPAPPAAPEPAPVQAAAPEPVHLGIDPGIAATVRARPGLQTHLSRLSLRGVGAVAAGVVLIVALVLFSNLPKNAKIARNGNHWLLPDDGYTFVDENDPLKWQVRWTPGKPSRVKASMLAGTEPGTWQLAPGYELPISGPNLDPVWKPGKRESAHPHVRAGEYPGKWIADPGWIVSGTATAPTATWVPGVRFGHGVTAEREGRWNIDDGYSFAPDASDEDPRMVWTPGQRHSEHARVYASDEEGKWTTEAGYAWVTDKPGDFRTYSPSRTLAALQSAGYIDSGGRGVDCSSSTALLAAFDDVSGRYSQIGFNEIHPTVAQHLGAVRDNFSSGSTVIRTCFFVENAHTGTTLIAAAACAFATDWRACMREAQQYIDVAEAAEKLGGVGCNVAWENFRTKRDELMTERYRLLKNFSGGSRITPPQTVTCR